MRWQLGWLGGGLIVLALGAGYTVSQGHCRLGFRAVAAQNVPAAQQPLPNVGKQAKTDGVEKAILDTANLYTEAFNRHDAKAIAALCTEDCEFIDRDGSMMRGHEEIEQEFKSTFAENPKARISLSLDSLRMLTPDVAIEQGTTVHFPDGKTATVETKYEVTHVRKNNRWLMAHGRSYDAEILTPYEYLRDLEWLVGNWVDESPDSVVEASYRWTDNKAFLLQEFTVRVQGKKVITGSQRIGWDPLAKHIKGWVFDSEGGYAENHWTSVDDAWVIKAKGVRSDGKIVTATNQLTRTGADRMAFQSVDRIVGEERMPNLAVTVVRKAPQPKR